MHLEGDIHFFQCGKATTIHQSPKKPRKGKCTLAASFLGNGSKTHHFKRHLLSNNKMTVVIYIELPVALVA